MLSIIFIALSMILLIAASIVIHEIGHLIAAKKAGWEFANVGIQSKGVFVTVKANEFTIHHLWKVAMAGPIATLLLAAMFYILSFAAPIFMFMFYFNLVVFLINIIPIKPSDGWNIIRGLKVIRSRTIDS